MAFKADLQEMFLPTEPSSRAGTVEGYVVQHQNQTCFFGMVALKNGSLFVSAPACVSSSHPFPPPWQRWMQPGKEDGGDWSQQPPEQVKDEGEDPPHD